jgi:hypothetical protein
MESVLEGIRPDVLTPPAYVVEARDEQALKREWDEACADEQDATERKAAVLREALKRWPMVLSSNPGQRARGMMMHSPEMRRFVRDVLGLPDSKGGGKGGSMNHAARQLLLYGAEGVRARVRDSARRSSSSRQLRSAVVELTTKYRLGADPRKCMEALAKFYEELTCDAERAATMKASRLGVRADPKCLAIPSHRRAV